MEIKYAQYFHFPMLKVATHTYSAQPDDSAFVVLETTSADRRRGRAWTRRDRLQNFRATGKAMMLQLPTIYLEFFDGLYLT